MSTQPEPHPTLIEKTLAFLSIIRWPNLLFLILAQFITAVFIMNAPENWLDTLADKKLIFIVLATFFIVGGGYILNNFYDWEKDLINRPRLTRFQNTIKRSTVLQIGFLFNLTGMLFAVSISFKGMVFFVVYGFLIWIYSHRIKKVTLLGNMLVSFLSVLPFFGIFFHYGFPELEVWIYATFFLIILFIKELIKDGASIKGDILTGYETLVAKFGWKTIRWVIALCIVPILAISIFLGITGSKLLMLFMIGINIITIGGIIYLFISPSQNAFRLVNIILKFVLALALIGIAIL